MGGERFLFAASLQVMSRGWGSWRRPRTRSVERSWIIKRGAAGPTLILESDDGSFRPADLQPEEFFLPFEEWPSWEQQLIGMAEGTALDLGAGAGRHSLYLQDLGHDATAVDVSPGAAAVCRARGIRDVRLADLRAFSTDRAWDTVLLMCGNLGLAGDWNQLESS